MATHLSFDHELTGEMMSGIRRHYGGLFAFGIDNVVVNVTKDRIWIPEAALPETANIARPEIDPAGFTPPEQMRPWACSADPEITM